MPQTFPMTWFMMCISIISNMKLNMITMYNKSLTPNNSNPLQINNIMWVW